MTSTNNKLAKAIRARLSEIDVERDQLVSLLELYTNGVVPNTITPKKTGGGFKKRSGGPTDRLIEAVRENPGSPMRRS